ncbi:MAG: hypothetical protein U1E73_10195 [Planctomycetota bacterium]
MTPRAAIAVRSAVAAVVAAVGFARALPAQRPGGAHLRSWLGALGFQAEWRDESNTNPNGAEISQTERLLRESLELRGHGDVYHPALLDIDAGVRTEFDQRVLSTDPAGADQRSDSVNFYYDAMARILKDKAINGDLYARRGRLETRQRFFATTTAVTSTEGADLRDRDLWIPSALHFEHTRYEGHGRDTYRQSTTRWKLDGSRSDDRDSISYSLEKNVIAQQTYDTKYDELLARANVGHSFGSAGEHSFTLGANYRDQSGDQSSLYEQASGGLQLQWLPTLHSDHSLSVEHSELNGGAAAGATRDGLIASTWLRHRLYESLDSSIGGRWYVNDFEVGRLERRDLEGELEYRKTAPFGSIGFGYHPTLYRENESGSGIVPATGEPHTFTLGVPLFLDGSHVVATSVFVRDAITTTVYALTADYLLVAVGDRLRLDVPVGSRIGDGTALLIDYLYEPSPGQTAEGLSQAVSLTFGFSDFATLGFEHSTDRVRLVSGIDDGTIGNSRRNAVRGWLGQWGQSLSAEYEDFDTFVSSTERVRVQAMSQAAPSEDTTLTHTAQWYRTRFKELDYVENGLSLTSDLQWRLTPIITAYGRAEYHRADYRTDTGHGYEFEVGFDLQGTRNTITLDARYAVEKFEVASDEKLLFFQFTFRRLF